MNCFTCCLDHINVYTLLSERIAYITIICRVVYEFTFELLIVLDIIKVYIVPLRVYEHPFVF